MNFSEEWKSDFPIGTVFTAPLLLPSSLSKAVVGPLNFNPIPSTKTQIFSSPSLSPPLLLPPPRLSLSRFLCTSTASDHKIIPSTATSIASMLGPQRQLDSAVMLAENRLRFLQWPGHDGVILFFSAGANHDQVGFLLLSVKNRRMDAIGEQNGGVLAANSLMGQRICKILVQPTSHCDGIDGNSSKISVSSIVIGHLLVCCLYSLNWYTVKFNVIDEMPVLDYLGCKVFKSCSVVSACWNPHFPTETVVLLENGSLFLFDMESQSSDFYFSGRRLKVSTKDSCFSEKMNNCKWLGCGFSWHPRILIIVRSDAVFLLDCRFGEGNVTCLASIDMFRLHSPINDEQFLAFSNAGFDHFHFVLCSHSFLVICDVRQPLMPVLQWKHDLDNPYSIEVFKLSQLRSNSTDGTYHQANKVGFGIILGSFWNYQFSLFCFGPNIPTAQKSAASGITKAPKSLHAWQLPSTIYLSGNECGCGNCVLKTQFMRESLPVWIDQQQKKDLILGYCILSNDLSSKLFGPDEFGGFTIIRLMASGKIELQRFSASWDLAKRLEDVHGSRPLSFKNSLLYFTEDEQHEISSSKKFLYYKLEYLRAHLNNALYLLVDSKLTMFRNESKMAECFNLDLREILCDKLKIRGFDQPTPSAITNAVLDDVSLPTSMHEISLTKLWSSFPVALLQLAFSDNGDICSPLAFLEDPDLPNLPPFILRTPSKRSNSLVGPNLPVPILIALHSFYSGFITPQEIRKVDPVADLNAQCEEEVAKAIKKIAPTYGDISLADDRDDIWAGFEEPKSFCLYTLPVIRCSKEGNKEQHHGFVDKKYASLVLKPNPRDSISCDKSAGVEFFDDLCPINLKFEKNTVNFSAHELKAYRVLKKNFLNWQAKFEPYEAFCSKILFQTTDDFNSL